jgi:hypothetical protein
MRAVISFFIKPIRGEYFGLASQLSPFRKAGAAIRTIRR